ncbi:MAG TPA: PPC domain-containing DNA-binding protein [Geminicoccaceae bacterium]
MQSKLIQKEGPRTLAVVLDTGNEVTECLLQVAKEHHLTAASFTGIGALREVVLGYFDWEKKDYREIGIQEQVEILNLTGNVALSDGEPKLHPHIVVGKADGTAWGGHLLKGIVRPTLEVVLMETPAHLHRKSDPETGLALLEL